MFMISPLLNKVINITLLILAATGPWIYARLNQVNEVQLLNQLLSNGSFPITIQVSVQFAGDVSFQFPDLIEATQFQIDTEMCNLTNNSLKIELINNFDGNNPSLYSVDLIHGNKNSLGISINSLKAYVFYTLESVHSNDLPFIIAQTVLRHLIRPEIDMINRPLTESITDSLDIKLKFAPNNAGLQGEVTEFMDDIKQKFVGILVLNWEIDNSLILEDNAILSVKLAEQNYTHMISEDSITKISELLQNHLQLSQQPRHNIYLKIEASYKTRTLQVLHEIINKNESTNTEKQKLLIKLADHLMSERNSSWSEHLTNALSLLDGS
ncbi:hypothetical protein JA1_005225 [Spathaspora sp. JA1]|nr:hypothetical protein JA1_005225 [Spathaspora sp. JA1]